MVSGGMSCVKYLLFVFNLIFLITGIAILAIGGIIQDFYSDYSDLLHGKFFVAPVLLIVVGVVIFIVAFFGCCGAIKENHCMIMTFAALIMIIFGLEVAGGITGYVLRNDVGHMLENTFNKTMHEYGSNAGFTKTWNIMQHDLSCCGIKSSDDWVNIFHNETLPDTCCKSENPCIKEYSYLEGCLPKLQKEMENYAILLGGVGIGVACIQLVGVIFACCLGNSIRKEYETV